MKIRLGFISNSSSTSFIIIGDIINGCNSTLIQKLLADGRLYVRAGEGYDGEDFFEMTNEMWVSYDHYGSKHDIEFYDVQILIEEDEKISKSDIEGDEFNIITMPISYHSCKTIEEFKERHLAIPDKIDPSVPTKIADKIKQVQELKRLLKKDGFDPDSI